MGRRLASLGCAFVLVCLSVPPVRAQNARAPAFSLETFRPAIDSHGYVTVDASQLLGHLDFSLGLVGSYAHDVLHLAGQGAQLDVEHYLTPQLQLAIGFFGRIELGVSLPLHIMFGARSPRFVDADPNHDSALTFSGQSIGDLGFHVKTRLVDGSRHAVGLGLGFSLYAPSGDARRFLGEGQVTLRPELIVDRAFGRRRRFKMALNLGALVRPATHSFTDPGATLAGVPDVAGGAAFCQPSSQLGAVPGSSVCGTQQTRALGSQLTYGLALSYAIVPQRFDLIGEAVGYVGLGGQPAASPLEGLLAAKVYLAQKSYFEIGGGAGLLPRSLAGGMTGAPGFRLFIGFIFEPSIGDRDGDGIKDDVDRCPDDPEDFDGFEDEDGCPDPDNDRDGILDRDDRCPDVPGPVANQGCPLSDRDHDGLVDREDACPDVAGPVENRGCPWPDRDKDSVVDKDDACSDVAGPAENQGCPYLDSDGDGLLDQDDECPHEWGPKENQGCPPKSITRLRGGRLLLLEPIFFETAKAIIKPVSYSTLDAVAAALQANPQLLGVEVQGHADERGDDDYNLRLTEERAAAVKAYLVGKGVSPDRLQSHGYGETRPVCREHGPRCWSENRRVEFVILRRSDH